LRYQRSNWNPKFHYPAGQERRAPECHGKDAFAVLI
jgi:hypothetical protein